MPSFSKPAEDFGNETREYLQARYDNILLLAQKGLASGMSALVGVLLICLVGTILVLALSVGLVLLLGEMIGSYAGAAFIVAGILALALAILLISRKSLFKNSFVSLSARIFFPDKEPVSDMDTLDKNIVESTISVYKNESSLLRSFIRAKDFYTPERVAMHGLSKVSGKYLGSGFGKFIPNLLKLFFRRIL